MNIDEPENTPEDIPEDVLKMLSDISEANGANPPVEAIPHKFIHVCLDGYNIKCSLNFDNKTGESCVLMNESSIPLKNIAEFSQWAANYLHPLSNQLSLERGYKYNGIQSI